jgi:hypothetical protein
VDVVRVFRPMVMVVVILVLAPVLLLVMNFL